MDRAPKSVDFRAEELLDTLSTAIVVMDRRLRVQYLNSAAESLFGISSQRAQGSAAADLLQEGATVFERLRKLPDAEHSVTERAAEFETRAGAHVIADTTITFNRDTEQLVAELQPLNRIQRINRDDQSLASLQTSRELIRGLAHEVKNPLGGLRGAAQLLERELDNPAHAEYTRIIIDEADRLTRLVDQLMGPTQQPRLGWFNIHHALEHVVSLLEAEQLHAISFLRDYDPSLPEIFGDESQIIQAVLNIVRNASQALAEDPPPDPTITLRTRIVRSFTIGSVVHRMVAQVDVIDNGPGIAPAIIDRIFYPMISGRAGGTGLGLAITQTIIGQHQGVIECDSQPRKTCFSIFLPLDGAYGQSPSSPSETNDD